MSKITELGAKLFHPKGEFRPRILDTEKRVRGVLDGKYVFDTTRAKLVWESKFSPQYWIPKTDFLPKVSFQADAPVSGIQSSTSKLTVGGKSVSTLLVPDSFNSELAGYVKIDFKDLDAWYEELAQVYIHPKDPFHRVDIIPSGRRVRIELAGTALADTENEGGVMSLWETNFPGRWYLPPTAVKWENLKPSSTKTYCPYKGEASYYNAVIDGKEYKDVVWWYESPTSESSLVQGMLCFYPDKVETIIDGNPTEKAVKPAVNGQQTDAHQHTSSCNC